MVVGWPTLPAAGTSARSLVEDPRFLLGTAVLAGVLLAGAMVIAWARRWRQLEQNRPPTTGDQLSYFRVLYERGELSQEEFEQIRARWVQELKHDSQAAGAAPAASPPPEAPEQGRSAAEQSEKPGQAEPGL
ncbi:MAG TPA: SHOCT domain-containing protein [Gemmataceae bacterium]|nr:SHOCT domain-containing protein [Gemmataceae bacterium]